MRRDLIALKRTVLELGRVLLAKRGHDPYGMLLRDRPWREAIPETWRAHRDWMRRERLYTEQDVS